MARLVRADRRVLRRFGSRVYWVTLGRDARRGSLAELVNGLVRQIDPRLAQPFADVQQAADHLAAVLAAGLDGSSSWMTCGSTSRWRRSR